VIDGLKHLRQKLDDDGRRVQREIVEYASLSRSVIQMTKIVSEGMTHVKNVPDAPKISDEALNSADSSVDETIWEQQIRSESKPRACRFAVDAPAECLTVLLSAAHPFSRTKRLLASAGKTRS